MLPLNISLDLGSSVGCDTLNVALHTKQSFQSNKTLRKPSGVLATYQGLFFQKTSKKEFKSDLGWHDRKKTL